MCTNSVAAGAIHEATRRSSASVVAHVFEHLHRHHPVEAARRRQNQVVDVAGDDVEVAQPARRGLLLDVQPLRVRIRHGGDARARVVSRHPQAQRAPAAAQLEDALAVGEPGALAGQGQHAWPRPNPAWRARHSGAEKGAGVVRSRRKPGCGSAECMGECRHQVGSRNVRGSAWAPSGMKPNSHCGARLCIAGIYGGCGSSDAPPHCPSFLQNSRADLR